MSFTFQKKEGILQFKDLGGYQTRNASTFWCISEADKIFNWDDFDEIVIHTGDYETNKNELTYSKMNSYSKLVPDFNFHSWPEAGINDYEKFVNEIDSSGRMPFEVNKVGWIGNTNTNKIRRKMLEISNKNKVFFDIFHMDWISSDNIMLNSTKYISTPELVKTYSVLIDIEGNGYSGRLKHLLWSHRPLLIVDRPHKEYFFEFLKEWEHYIPVKGDLSDLLEKTKWCFDNYDKGLQIAENAFKFSKCYLTRNACYNQWNKIIKAG